MHRTFAAAALAVLTPASWGQVESWRVVLGDSTGDGIVDAADYLVWRETFGDCNRSGAADTGDLNDWRANFGNTAGASVDGFNGSILGAPVPAAAELAWGGVPLRGLFLTGSAYEAWALPMTSAAAVRGDYDGDGTVDAADYVLWRKTGLDTATLSGFLAALGDFDGDGDVDGRDFLVWRKNMGGPGVVNTNALAGDFDADGAVDSGDYVLWRDAFGSSLGGLAPGANNDAFWIITPASLCPADINADGLVNVDDIQEFVEDFLGGGGAGDCDGSGMINVDDIDCFVAAFLAGCP